MLLHLFLVVDRAMDESMDLSEASFETASDEETDALIRDIDEQRTRTMENWLPNSVASIQMKTSLQESSKLWNEHRAFQKDTCAHCHDAKASVIPMLKELYDAASSSDNLRDEDRTQQEERIQTEISHVLEKQDEYRRKISLFTDARTQRRKERSAQLEILEKEKAEKQLKATQHRVMAEHGFSSFGIEMEHKTTPTGVRLKIRFRKLSTIPGAEAGVIVEIGDNDSRKLIEQWPKDVPGMRDLEMRLTEESVDLTGFLVAARGYFREFTNLPIHLPQFSANERALHACFNFYFI